MNTSRWRRHVMWLSVLAIVLAACGDGGETGGEGDGTTVPGGEGDGTTAPAEECTEPDPVRLQLQWFAQSQFAGYYVALDNGFYEAQCLDVEILEGAVEIVPQQVLATGGAEFGIAWVPKALVSREGGADIVNIAQVFERSGTLQVSWADSGIETPADWEGKRVGNWGFGNEYEVLAAIEKFDVTVGELVAQDFTMNALLNDEIDAAEAMIYNEYAQVLEAVNPGHRRAVHAGRPQRHRLQRRVRRYGDAPGRSVGHLRLDRRRGQRGHRHPFPHRHLPGLDPLSRRLRRMCRGRIEQRLDIGPESSGVAAQRDPWSHLPRHATASE